MKALLRKRASDLVRVSEGEAGANVVAQPGRMKRERAAQSRFRHATQSAGAPNFIKCLETGFVPLNRLSSAAIQLQNSNF
jgi:hypothetical protein